MLEGVKWLSFDHDFGLWVLVTCLSARGRFDGGGNASLSEKKDHFRSATDVGDTTGVVYLPRENGHALSL
jgi:hypothetical protein